MAHRKIKYKEELKIEFKFLQGKQIIINIFLVFNRTRKRTKVMGWHQQSLKLPLKSEMDDDTQAATPLKLYQPYEECSCKPSLQTKDRLEPTTQSQMYVLYQLWDLRGTQCQQEKPLLLLLAE